ncbi:MAG: aminotransferase class V-fold PLP-dependent enzyme [Burkholderiaceae bacterium]|nr:aminotransferase class V-fold PLP-dependent enzyme [Burkholderiaceae bacterium]
MTDSNMLPQRRNALRFLASVPILPLFAATSTSLLTACGDSFAMASGPTDPVYWDAVRKLYAVNTQISNLENGYWGVMTERVRLEFQAKNDMINRDNTLYARGSFGADAEAVRVKLAEAVGASKEEIAFTRGATEALQLLIAGYNQLKAGDTVVYSDLDYDSMQYAMEWLKERRGVNVVKFAIPEPATRAAVLQAYQKALADNPSTKLLLLTHISHRTGLVMPVAEIAAMARARGVDTILDAAHSWGQLDFKVADLGVDFVGFNLHKWIGAPLGLGFLYIKQGRLAAIDRAYGDMDFAATDVRSRVHTGTTNFATLLTLPMALAVHAEIGPKAKADRLVYLRDYWVNRVSGLPNLEILTPNEPGMYAGITSFRFAGKVSSADNTAIVTELRDQHGVLTVRRGGVAKGHCIRVSPALYTTEADLDKLVLGLTAISKRLAT